MSIFDADHPAPQGFSIIAPTLMASGKQKVEDWLVDKNKIFDPDCSIVLDDTVVSSDDNGPGSEAPEVGDDPNYDFFEQKYDDASGSKQLIVLAPHATEEKTPWQASRVRTTRGTNTAAWRTRYVQGMTGVGATPRHPRLHVTSVDINPDSFPYLDELGEGYEYAFAFHGFKRDCCAPEGTVGQSDEGCCVDGQESCTAGEAELPLCDEQTQYDCGEGDYCIYVGGGDATLDGQEVLARMLRDELNPSGDGTTLKCNSDATVDHILPSGAKFSVRSGDSVPDSYNGDSSKNIIHRLTSPQGMGMQVEQTPSVRGACHLTIADVVAEYYDRKTSVPGWDNLVLWYTFDDATNGLLDQSRDATLHHATLNDPGTADHDIEFLIEGQIGYVHFENNVDPNNPPASQDTAWISVAPGLHPLQSGRPFYDDETGEAVDGLTISARIRLDLDAADYSGFNFLCYGCGPFYLWSAGVAYPERGRQYSSPINGGSWRPYSDNTSSKLFEDDTWTIVTVVVKRASGGDPGSVRYYRDCEDVTLSATPPAGFEVEFLDYTAPLGDQTFIANGGSNKDYAFDGDIDDIKVWNRALSPAEVDGLCP